MSPTDVPRFRYHPDPIATGSVVASDRVCVACGQPRGYVYVGPVYSAEDLDESLCPWCISDGTAHQRLGAEFVDPSAVGGYGAWEAVPREVVEEVAYRTPSFSGWQQERWFTHCKDAAELLGPCGWDELQKMGPQAIEAVGNECTVAAADVMDYLRALSRDAGPTAYLFRCLHCGQIGGYSDCH